MERNEALAQEAVRYLGLAQRFEQEGNIEKAIEHYGVAADYLKNSGYMMQRIDEIYSRIEELKKFVKQEVFYRQEHFRAQVEQVQEQAFSLLDGAQKLESDGFLEDAIGQYMSAIKLLVQSGWTENQLGNLKSKIAVLAGNLERQKIIQTQKEIESQVLEAEPQVVGAFGKKKIVSKAEELKRYREAKQREEQIQADAFAFIDNAKFFEKDNKFDKAIDSYEKAIELLNLIGWQTQTQNIALIVQKLRKDKKEYEIIKTQKPLERKYIKGEVDIKGFDEFELDEFKKDEEKIQIDAFNLIDIGKKLEREKKYDKAITKYEKAIELLKSIEWDSYIQPIVNFIKSIEEKQKYEERTESLKEKRESDVKSLQDKIFLKEREEIVQTARELEQKRLQFEQKRRNETRKENEFFTTLDNADKILKENSDFNKAVVEYQKALELLKGLGAGWESYAGTIKSTISSINTLKETQIEKELEQQKRLERQNKVDLEFQQHISIELAKERERIKQSEIKLKLKRDEIEYREQRKDAAFKALEEAEEYINQSNLDNAILAYQTAGNIFAGIQWDEELHLIEDSIRNLEIRKREQSLTKQKDLQKSIDRYKAEQSFHEQISKQLQEERERLSKREIKIRERDAELEHRERRKEEAFKVLGEAQKLLEKGNYEKVIELYQLATNIFAEIQWYDEVEKIGNAIVEIENKNRETGIKKQRDMLALIEKERVDRAFQESTIKEMKAQREKLKQKEITFREREKEVLFREKRKEEAFKILEEAQNFLSLGEFDMAIESYRNVSEIFAQIQWVEELPLIKQAISDIEIKKKEKELWKQKAFQEAIKKETDHSQFLDHVKRQREIEKIKIQKGKELFIEKKELAAETKAKEKEAFKVIDEADILLRQESFDEALQSYSNALSILNDIGWTGSYMTLLEDTIRLIQFKKKEKDQRIIREKERLKNQIDEEREFERKITEHLQSEKDRMISKKIELRKKEDLVNYMEQRKLEAFNIMDKAEVLLKQGLYEHALNMYYQSELILTQIRFPTDAIKEMIRKIQEKKRKDDLAKQHEFELIIKKTEEEKHFLQTIVESMKYEEEKMKAKKIQLKEREDLKIYLEKRKDIAFEIFDEANAFMKQGKYNKALEYYRSAELILNEIQFPTDSIKELIVKVKEKKREHELQKQKELEFNVQKEREEIEFQKKVADDIREKKERLKLKQIEIGNLELLQTKLEKRKDEAFLVLEKAEHYINRLEYDLAIASYRKAMLILNEIQFPSDSINNMIEKVINLKKQKEFDKQHKLQRELERLKEEKHLQEILNERKKQEKEKKIAQQLALQQRERLVQDQLTNREVAYSLLEEGAEFLKRGVPNFDKAISLYIQARDLLAEKIGWEPEINNLNILIKDLIQQKGNFVEKKRLEAEAKIKRQREYEVFREEIQKRRTEYEIKKRQQQLKVKRLFESKRDAEITKEKGLRLIDEGKQAAIIYDFKKAYKNFNSAVEKFKQIGWIEQIKYIQKEIENTRLLEQRTKEEDIKIQKIREDLENQRRKKERQEKEDEKKLKMVVGEVSDLSIEVSKLIEIKKQQDELKIQQKSKQIVSESKEFRKDLKEFIALKQDLMNELSKSKEDSEKRKGELKLAKDKEKADEIKKMLKEISKKEKK